MVSAGHRPILVCVTPLFSYPTNSILVHILSSLQTPISFIVYVAAFVLNYVFTIPSDEDAALPRLPFVIERLPHRNDTNK